MLAGGKLCVHPREATDLAQILILKFSLVHYLATENDRWTVRVLDRLLLVFLLTLSDENFKLFDHLLIPLHEIELTWGALLVEESPDIIL